MHQLKLERGQRARRPSERGSSLGRRRPRRPPALRELLVRALRDHSSSAKTSPHRAALCTPLFSESGVGGGGGTRRCVNMAIGKNGWAFRSACLRRTYRGPKSNGARRNYCRQGGPFAARCHPEDVTTCSTSSPSPSWTPGSAPA